MRIDLRIILVVFALLLMCRDYTDAQMEKRKDGRYNQKLFLTSAPRIGERAPNIELFDLDAKKVDLDAFRGQNIVLVKAGFT